jgi:hypothetical protein
MVLWFLDVLDEAQHQLFEPLTAENLMGNIISVLLITRKTYLYLLLVPEVPASDDILMGLCKAVAQWRLHTARIITSNTTSIIWGLNKWLAEKRRLVYIQATPALVKGSGVNGRYASDGDEGAYRAQASILIGRLARCAIANITHASFLSFSWTTSPVLSTRDEMSAS